MKTNTIKTGDVVMYARPVDDDDRSLRFVVIQQPDDRGKITIKLIDATYRIAPIETIATEEIVLA